MFYSCDKKEIVDLKQRVKELETLKEQLSSCNEIKGILAEIKKTNEQEFIEIKKALNENDKSTINRSLFSDFKWILPIIATFIIGLGASLIPINKNDVFGVCLIIIGILIILIPVCIDIYKCDRKQKDV